MQGEASGERHGKFCKSERIFSNVKSVPEELKEADQLGGQWGPARENEGMMTTGAISGALREGGRDMSPLSPIRCRGRNLQPCSGSDRISG